MEWIMVTFYIIIYFLIGGFLNGLFDMDMEALVIIWPVMYILVCFVWLCDMAENLGSTIRELLRNRKESGK